MARGRAKRFALDLGASSVKACELVQTSSGVRLTKFVHINLGIDPSMPPEEKEALKLEGISRVFKAGGFKQKRVILAVPGQSVFVRTRLLPPVQESRLAQIVQYEIQQQIPFPLDQIALDYQVIKRTETKEYDVMMTAIKVDTVDSFAQVIINAKLRIDAVDVVPVATYNWLRFNGELSKAEAETVACIDIGASTTDIFIERGGEFRFTRSLTIAGNHITEAIKDALGVPFQEAERLKITVGRAMLAAEPAPNPATQEGKVLAVIGEVINRLAHEINRSFGFFRTQSGGSPVARVVLCGGSAALRNIQQFMAERLEVPVSFADPFKKLSIAPAAASAQAIPHLLPTCLGLGLRNVMRCPLEINLIPPRIIQAEKRKERGVYWGLSFFTLVLIAMAVVPIYAQRQRLMLAEKKNLEKEIEVYQKNQGQVTELAGKRDGFKQKYDILNELAGADKRFTWLNPINEACKVVPKGVWLGQIECIKYQVDATGATAAGGGGMGGLGGMLGGMGGLSGMGGGGGLSGGGVLSGGGFRGGTESGGLGLMGGAGGGALGAGASITLPQVDGLRIAGYAEQLSQIEEFRDALKKLPMFSEVFLYSRNITRVDKYSLQSGGTGGVYGGGASGMGGMFGGGGGDGERRSFGGLLGGGFSGMNPGAGQMYQSPQLAEKNQVFAFTIDVKIPI